MSLTVLKAKLRSWTYELSLLILIAIGSLMRFLYLDPSLRWEDSVHYVMQAEGLVSTSSLPFYGYGYSLLIALFFRIFGVNEEAAKYCTALFGVLSIPVVFWLTSMLFNRKVGLVSAILLTFAPFHWFYSIVVMADVPAVFFILLTVTFFVKYDRERKPLYALLTGLTLIFSVYVKNASILITLPILAYLIIKDGVKWVKDRNIVGFVLTPLFGLILYLIYYWFTAFYQLSLPLSRFFSLKYALYGEEVIVYGQSIGAYGHLLIYLAYLLCPYLLLFNKYVEAYTAMIPFLSFIGLWILAKRKDYPLFALLLFWMAVFPIFYGFFYVFAPRYILPAIIPFIITASLAFYEILQGMIEGKPLLRNKIMKGALPLFSLLILIGPSIAVSYPYISYLHTHPSGYKTMSIWIKDNTPPNSTIITGASTFVEYYANRRVVPIGEFQKAEIEQLLKEGYPVYATKDWITDSYFTDRWQNLSQSFTLTYITTIENTAVYTVHR